MESLQVRTKWIWLHEQTPSFKCLIEKVCDNISCPILLEILLASRRILTISILYNILAHSICILELLSVPNVVLEWPIYWGNSTFLMHDVLICIHLIELYVKSWRKQFLQIPRMAVFHSWVIISQNKVYLTSQTNPVFQKFDSNGQWQHFMTYLFGNSTRK